MIRKVVSWEDELRLVHPVAQVARHVRTYAFPREWVANVKLTGAGKMSPRTSFAKHDRRYLEWAMAHVPHTGEPRVGNVDGVSLHALDRDDATTAYSLMRQFATAVDGGRNLDVDVGAVCATFAYVSAGLEDGLQVILAYDSTTSGIGGPDPIGDVDVLDADMYPYSREDARRSGVLAIASFSMPAPWLQDGAVYGYGRRTLVSGSTSTPTSIAAVRMVTECMVDCIADGVREFHAYVRISLPRALVGDLSGRLPPGISLLQVEDPRETERPKFESAGGWGNTFAVLGMDHAVSLYSIREAVARCSSPTTTDQSVEFGNRCFAIIVGMTYRDREMGVTVSDICPADLPTGTWRPVINAVIAATLKAGTYTGVVPHWDYRGASWGDSRTCRHMLLDTLCWWDEPLGGGDDYLTKVVLEAFGTDEHERAMLFVRACKRGCGNAALRLAEAIGRVALGKALWDTEEGLEVIAMVTALSDPYLGGRRYLPEARAAFRRRAGRCRIPPHMADLLLAEFDSLVDVGYAARAGWTAEGIMDRITEIRSEKGYTRYSEARQVEELREVTEWRTVARKGTVGDCLARLLHDHSGFVGRDIPWLIVARESGVIARVLADRTQLAKAANILGGLRKWPEWLRHGDKDATLFAAVNDAIATVARMHGTALAVDFAEEMLRSALGGTVVPKRFAEAILQSAESVVLEPLGTPPSRSTVSGDRLDDLRRLVAEFGRFHDDPV